MGTAKLTLVGDTNHHTCVIVSILFTPSFLRVAIIITIAIAIIVANPQISPRAH